MKFEPGDIVYLSIGSPLMTVRAIIDDDTVLAQWFDTDFSYLHQAEFDMRQLIKHHAKPVLNIVD